MNQLNPRTQIIQMLIDKNKYKSYLEIGVERGDSFLHINCEKMVGVDPDPRSKANVFLPSDDFFAQNNETFDIIFVDGLHLKDQVIRDIENSLLVLNEGGIILVHDVLPENIFIARIIDKYEEDGTAWTGSTWEGWVHLRTTRPDLKMFITDADYGLGVIHPGKQELVSFNFELPYEEKFNNWRNDKKRLSNIIQVHEFFKDYIYV